MDPQRLVLVRTKGPDGVGSGYLVGPQLVLTALHVVLPEGRWAERVETRVGHPHFGDLVQRRAQVCWPDTRHGIPPEDALDVALLWLDVPVLTSGGPVRWGRPGGAARIPFKGAGFPAFAADDVSTVQVEDLHGELSVVSTPGWVLDCPVWPAPGRMRERPWAGASGSAVFCRGRLVGVAVEDNRTMDWRRLHAAPIQEALSLPGFAHLIAKHGHLGTTSLLEKVTAETGPPASGRDVVVWPVEVGPVPTLASAFQPRRILRDRIDTARSGGESFVLTQVLSGGGGVGKTQLAAACATDALKQGVDLVVWASATEAQQVITQYAQAAADIQLPTATGQDPESDARALLKWLATTSRRWLVVLDDVNHPTALNGWWPVSRTGTGGVLATTRLDDARFTGGGRTRVYIDVYSPDEADAYLRERMRGHDMGHLLDKRASALAEALGHLPLALGLAAAHMINEELSCTAYLRLFTDRGTRLEEALPETADSEGYGRQITVALLLSLDAAQAADSTGLALPILRLSALLDPAGHPHALWTSPPLLDYLATHHTPPRTEKDAPHTPHLTGDQAHAVLRLLHRYGLITCDTGAEPRAVRIHALTARAIREITPGSDLPRLADRAAEALLDAWPEIDQSHPGLATTLRANTEALADHAHDHLWRPEGHRVLYRAGTSLLAAGLVSTATTYWQNMAHNAERLLGDDHPDTLTTRGNLAASYQQAGRTREAIDLLEQVAADCERVLGDAPLYALTACGNLADLYQQAGRNVEAIDLLEQVVLGFEGLLGNDHPNTLTARANLAKSYVRAGRTRRGIEIEEQVVASFERVLGDDHPSTLTARANLAASYQQAGRNVEAIDLLERVLAIFDRVLGSSHPDALATRANLAFSYERAGRTREAIEIMERVVADCERVLGDDHPKTLTARFNLAFSFGRAGRIGETIGLLEQVLADRERVLGHEHPDTLTTRRILTAAPQRMKRKDEPPEAR
ncbi:tetratricopeptide repeat protein [Streptomyces sp. DT203]|uniref:tetratricopeptide repeat protein n=1 Tax=Streptomyces sp. DT203 TaxID=3393424 RepID=UPI003CF5A547